MANVVKNDGKVATQAYDEICDYLTKTGLSTEDAKKVAALVVNLDKNLKVIDESDPNVPNGEYPILEAAAEALVDAVDLAVLAAKLKIDSEKFQAFVRKTGLDHLNNELDEKMAERLEKIKESLKKMDEAAKSSKFSKIFGWLMVAVSVIMAVATCGAAGAFVVGAVLGAVVAVTMQALTQAGVMEKLSKAIVRSLMDRHPEMSRREAEIKAAIYVAVIVLAASCTSFTPGSFGNFAKSFFSDICKKVADTINNYIQPVLKGVGFGLQLHSNITNFDAGTARAKTTELKAELKLIMKEYDILSDEMTDLIEQLADAGGQLEDILEEYNDSQKNIAFKMSRLNV